MSISLPRTTSSTDVEDDNGAKALLFFNKNSTQRIQLLSNKLFYAFKDTVDDDIYYKLGRTLKKYFSKTDKSHEDEIRIWTVILVREEIKKLMLDDRSTLERTPIISCLKQFLLDEYKVTY